MTEFKTPYFLINEAELNEGISSLEQALLDGWGKHIIGYSFKTNSLPWINKQVKKRGCYAEVVSSPEYKLALAMGFSKKHIIFNGPVKGKKEFYDAVLNGSIVNIDSRREIKWLNELSSLSNQTLNVGLRVNVELPHDMVHEIGYPGQGSRFGFSISNGDLNCVINELKQITNVSIIGLHLHLTSKSRSLEVYKVLAKIACEVKRKTSIAFRYVDIGGGFFGGVPGKPSFVDYVEIVAEGLKEEFDPSQTTLIVEPGSALIASPISFITEVIDVKDTSKSRIVTIDGSRTNIDPLMIKTNHFYDLHTRNTQILDEQIIVGFTCMEMDRLMVLRDSPKLSVGDRIVFGKVGAYTMSLSPLFIQYFPPVYVLDGQTCTKVRGAWGIKEYLQTGEYEIALNG